MNYMLDDSDKSKIVLIYSKIIKDIYELSGEESDKLASEYFDFILAKGADPCNTEDAEHDIRVVIGAWLGKSYNYNLKNGFESVEERTNFYINFTKEQFRVDRDEAKNLVKNLFDYLEEHKQDVPNLEIGAKNVIMSLIGYWVYEKEKEKLVNLYIKLIRDILGVRGSQVKPLAEKLYFHLSKGGRDPNLDEENAKDAVKTIVGSWLNDKA